MALIWGQQWRKWRVGRLIAVNSLYFGHYNGHNYSFCSALCVPGVWQRHGAGSLHTFSVVTQTWRRVSEDTSHACETHLVHHTSPRGTDSRYLRSLSIKKTAQTSSYEAQCDQNLLHCTGSPPDLDRKPPGVRWKWRRPRQNYGCLTPISCSKLCLRGRWSRLYLLWVARWGRRVGVIEHCLSINCSALCTLNTAAEVSPPHSYSLKCSCMEPIKPGD